MCLNVVGINLRPPCTRPLNKSQKNESYLFIRQSLYSMPPLLRLVPADATDWLPVYLRGRRICM